jgi:shikimate dehydrogenase
MTSYNFGLTGFPLDHSLSPRIHNAALRALDLSGEYRLYAIPPLPDGDEQLSELLDRLREGDLLGLNVTIPHKEAIIPFLDGLTPTAEAIGAVNTLWMQDEDLVGDNTDAPAFQTDLRHFLSTLPHRPPRGRVMQTNPVGRVLILGAGGAARGVAYALLQMGVQALTIATRRRDQAQELARELVDYPTHSAPEFIDPLAWPFKSLPTPVDLIVNCTPLGMSPEEESNPWPEGLPFPQGVIAYDLVYNPAETRFLQEAQEAGSATRSGLGMLVEQAALSFQRWTGQEAPREEMWASVAPPETPKRR